MLEEAKQSGLYRASESGLVWTCRIPGMKKQLFNDRWIVTGTVTGTYLSFKFRNFNVYCHLFVWYWFNGPIPDGWEVDHLDNDPLNNCLSNLEAVTKSENQIRRWARRPELREQHRQIFKGREFSELSKKRMSEAARRRTYA